MGRVYGIELPKGLAKELNEVLRAVPNAELCQAATEHLGGDESNPGKVRSRVSGMIGGAGDLPPWVLDLLRPYACLAGALGCLSVETVERLFDDLCVLHGPDKTVLAGLIESRKEVRALAQSRVGKRFGRPNAGERQGAISRVAKVGDQLAGLTPHSPVPERPAATRAGHPIGGRPVDLREGDPADGEPESNTERMLARVTAMEERERDLKQQLKQKDKESRRVRQEKEKKLKDSHRLERERLEAEIKRLSEGGATATAQATDLRRELRLETQRRETAIREEVERRTSAALRPWLEHPNSIAEYDLQRSGSVAELLDRARALLEEQAKRDKSAGHRRRLFERLADLRSVLGDLTDARENSLHPLPGLADASREIAAEIAAIEGRLKRAPAPEPTTTRLVALINEAENLKGLEACRRLIEQVARADLIPVPDREHLDAALHRRLSLLQDKASFRGDRDNRLDGWELGGVLHRNRRVSLFIDGHNVIFRFHGRALDGPDPAYERVLREEFVACVERLVRPRGEVATRIVFDGPNAGTNSRLPNLVVEYSGGAVSEADRADRVIQAHLGHLRAEDRSAELYLVSDDLRLAVAAQDHRAHLVSVAQFRHFLEKYGAMAPGGGE